MRCRRCLIGCYMFLSATRCRTGLWGTECRKRCRCLRKSESCDVITGSCVSGCQAGYTGPGCGQLCPLGSQGLNCSTSCAHCHQGACHPITGVCTEVCHPGWSGALCRTPCRSEQRNCSSPCGKCQGGPSACDVTRGVCRGRCLPGFTGIDCSIKCPRGVWGPGCRSVCGQCQRGDSWGCHEVLQSSKSRCHPRSCVRGFNGDLCQTLQTACLDGDCRCGSCRRNDSCDALTGLCKDGCANQTSGPTCLAECGRLDENNAEERHLPWMHMISIVMTSIAVILIAFAWATWRITTERRRAYVQGLLKRLTYDNLLQSANPEMMEQSRRVKQPQLLLDSLSKEDRVEVLEELDCLLSSNESYEDFVRSTRYKELRVLVANKAWATDTCFRRHTTSSTSLQRESTDNISFASSKSRAWNIDGCSTCNTSSGSLRSTPTIPSLAVSRIRMLSMGSSVDMGKNRPFLFVPRSILKSTSVDKDESIDETEIAAEAARTTPRPSTDSGHKRPVRFAASTIMAFFPDTETDPDPGSVDAVHIQDVPQGQVEQIAKSFITNLRSQKGSISGGGGSGVGGGSGGGGGSRNNNRDAATVSPSSISINFPVPSTALPPSVSSHTDTLPRSRQSSSSVKTNVEIPLIATATELTTAAATTATFIPSATLRRAAFSVPSGPGDDKAQMTSLVRVRTPRRLGEDGRTRTSSPSSNPATTTTTTTNRTTSSSSTTTTTNRTTSRTTSSSSSSSSTCRAPGSENADR